MEQPEPAATQQLIAAIEKAAAGSPKSWAIGTTDDPTAQLRMMGDAEGFLSWRACCPSAGKNVVGYFTGKGMSLYGTCEARNVHIFIYRL